MSGKSIEERVIEIVCEQLNTKKEDVKRETSFINEGSLCRMTSALCHRRVRGA